MNDLFDLKGDYHDYCATPIGKKSYQFDQQNPHVYQMFKRFAGEARSRGYQQYSANGIFERMRWETSMVSGDVEFKMNNNLRAYYARKLMHEESIFKGFFSIKGGVNV